jgi:17beta-estradiol 17-dehydrogenase / very-long-chain 3-oxoacyl-CoA reductase
MHHNTEVVYPFALAIGIYLGYRFLVWVILPIIFTCSSSGLAKKYNKSGKAWAIVTGTTSGIGSGFAKVLVKSGFNVMMIARNETKLSEMKKELVSFKKSKDQQIEYLVMDLSSGKILNDNFTSFVNKNEVSVLVNNAGVNTDYPKLFSDNSYDEVKSIVDVNCEATVVLTRAVVPGMSARKKGCVVNISSLFGQIGAPLLSVYSGSKSFIASFSASLGAELGGSGVSVFCSLPGFVVSNMSKIRRTSLTVISADACAEAVLGQVAGGWLSAAAPHWSHSLIGWLLMDVVPEPIRMRVLTRVNRATNKAALRKLERAQKQE